MKKIILLIFVILIASGTFWYVKNQKKDTVDPLLKTYRNTNLGISFVYPKILNASTTSSDITLHHEVPFEHHDFCDFKGEIDTTIQNLTDFHVNFHVVGKNIVETMRAESPYIPEENFVNGEVVPSPGFIDVFNVGEMKGFNIFEGAEGCGQTTYYLSVEKNKTLVIRKKWITIFSGVIDVENKSKAEAVPGVINKEKEDQIFDSILQTLKID